MSNLKDKIYQFCSEQPIATDKIAIEISKSSLVADDDDFEFIVHLSKQDDTYDDYLSSPAMASLPAWGEKGVDQLIDFAFNDNYKNRTQSRAIEVLLAISRNIEVCSKRVKYLNKAWDTSKKYSLSEKVSNYALYSLRESLLLSFEDEWGRSRLLFILGLMGQLSGFEGGAEKEDLDYFLSLIVDNHLLINPSIIGKFESLLDGNPDHEEKLQKFLTEHPILLDPFVSNLYTKQELGSDFITDYVIRQMDNNYVLVEIENSTDQLFNQNGSFTSDLTTAIAQVRDFQAWISDNLSYARKKLPKIKHPGGLVVIGRKSKLTDIEIKRLAEENHSRRGHIKIVTYDDLLETARIVYKNIIERPAVFKTRDTRCI